MTHDSPLAQPSAAQAAQGTPTPAPDDTLQAERDEYLQGWKRALADYENYKKEQAQRAIEVQEYQRIEFFRELLPLVDTLDQALEHVPPNEQQSPWFLGFKALQGQWKQFLASYAVASLESLGKPFDPEIHEAIGTTADPDTSDNTVSQVATEGYTLNTKLIRPAKVIVNTLTK